LDEALCTNWYWHLPVTVLER